MGISIGIDLGTTFSVVSYLKNGTDPEVIPNDYGNRTTPSVVLYQGDNSFIVGESAIDLSTNYPAENLIRFVKREIGSHKTYIFGDNSYTPEDISSEILKYLKNLAERFTGEEVESAVITVPAYFNNKQRQATKIAGELAGLNVSRIINEPTAASLAYGLDKNHDSTILVFDLGGGTFDVTLLKLSDGCDFHVLATSGNTKLGGIDFDLELAKFVFKEFVKENSEELNDLKFEDLSLSELDRLLVGCEKIKKALSLSLHGYAIVPNFIFKKLKYYNLQVKVSRSDFENSISDLVELLKFNIDNCLSDSSLSYGDLDEVVFVGGSTRIPLISQKVYEWTGKNANKSINPDEAVSVGAAIQASVLSGKTEKEVYLLDVIPLSLGIETQGGFMTTMIKRNSTIPAQVQEVFTTAIDNQTSVDVKVFQGERPQVINNQFLGEFKLENIPLAKKGLPKINVIFSVDANGILKVEAIDEETKQSKSLILSDNTSLENVNKLLKDAEENKVSDEQFKQISKFKDWLTDYLIQIDQLIDANVLNAQEICDLKDLKKSIESDINTNNLELLNSLVHSAKETIELYSEKVYNVAKKIMQ